MFMIQELPSLGGRWRRGCCVRSCVRMRDDVGNEHTIYGRKNVAINLCWTHLPPPSIPFEERHCGSRRAVANLKLHRKWYPIKFIALYYGPPLCVCGMCSLMVEPFIGQKCAHPVRPKWAMCVCVCAERVRALNNIIMNSWACLLEMDIRCFLFTRTRPRTHFRQNQARENR